MGSAKVTDTKKPRSPRPPAVSKETKRPSREPVAKPHPSVRPSRGWWNRVDGKAKDPTRSARKFAKHSPTAGIRTKHAAAQRSAKDAAVLKEYEGYVQYQAMLLKAADGVLPAFHNNPKNGQRLLQYVATEIRRRLRAMRSRLATGNFAQREIAKTITKALKAMRKAALTGNDPASALATWKTVYPKLRQWLAMGLDQDRKTYAEAKRDPVEVYVLQQIAVLKKMRHDVAMKSASVKVGGKLLGAVMRTGAALTMVDPTGTMIPGTRALDKAGDAKWSTKGYDTILAQLDKARTALKSGRRAEAIQLIKQATQSPQYAELVQRHAEKIGFEQKVAAGLKNLAVLGATVLAGGVGTLLSAPLRARMLLQTSQLARAKLWTGALALNTAGFYPTMTTLTGSWGDQSVGGHVIGYAKTMLTLGLIHGATAGVGKTASGFIQKAMAKRLGELASTKQGGVLLDAWLKHSGVLARAGYHTAQFGAGFGAMRLSHVLGNLMRDDGTPDAAHDFAFLCGLHIGNWLAAPLLKPMVKGTETLLLGKRRAAELARVRKVGQDVHATWSKIYQQILQGKTVPPALRNTLTAQMASYARERAAFLEKVPQSLRTHDATAMARAQHEASALTTIAPKPARPKPSKPLSAVDALDAATGTMGKIGPIGQRPRPPMEEPRLTPLDAARTHLDGMPLQHTVADARGPRIRIVGDSHGKAYTFGRAMAEISAQLRAAKTIADYHAILQHPAIRRMDTASQHLLADSLRRLAATPKDPTAIARMLGDVEIGLVLQNKFEAFRIPIETLATVLKHASQFPHRIVEHGDPRFGGRHGTLRRPRAEAYMSELAQLVAQAKTAGRTDLLPLAQRASRGILTGTMDAKAVHGIIRQMRTSLAPAKPPTPAPTPPTPTSPHVAVAKGFRQLAVELRTRATALGDPAITEQTANVQRALTTLITNGIRPTVLKTLGREVQRLRVQIRHKEMAAIRKLIADDPHLSTKLKEALLNRFPRTTVALDVERQTTILKTQYHWALVRIEWAQLYTIAQHNNHRQALESLSALERHLGRYSVKDGTRSTPDITLALARTSLEMITKQLHPSVKKTSQPPGTVAWNQRIHLADVTADLFIDRAKGVRLSNLAKQLQKARQRIAMHRRSPKPQSKAIMTETLAEIHRLTIDVLKSEVRAIKHRILRLGILTQAQRQTFARRADQLLKDLHTGAADEAAYQHFKETTETTVARLQWAGYAAALQDEVTALTQRAYAQGNGELGQRLEQFSTKLLGLFGQRLTADQRTALRLELQPLRSQVMGKSLGPRGPKR